MTKLVVFWILFSAFCILDDEIRRSLSSVFFPSRLPGTESIGETL